MASPVSQPLNNHCLPPLSNLTAAIHPVPTVANDENKSILAESSKKPKIVLKFKLKAKNSTTCDDDSAAAGSGSLGTKKGSEEAATPKPSSSSSDLTIETDQPTLIMNGQAEPEKIAASTAAKSRRVAAKKKAKQEIEKEKEHICITLSKKEIEEDILAIRKRSGLKLLKERPKKRPKTLQKQLDLLFPGWV